MQKLQRFKKTPLESLPEEWKIYKGEDIFVLSSGVSPTEVNFKNNGNVDTLYVKSIVITLVVYNVK